MFGSIAYTHVPDERRTKLDDNIEKYVFVGYDLSSKGYKIYNPNSRKIVISHDVECEEENCWDMSVQEENSSEMTPRLMSIEKLYEVTENQNDIDLFCLFGDCEPLSYPESEENIKWRDAMD